MVTTFAEAIKNTDSNLYIELIKPRTTIPQLVSAYRLASIATKFVDDPSFQYRMLRRVANPAEAGVETNVEAGKAEAVKLSSKPERLFLKFFQDLEYPHN